MRPSIMYIIYKQSIKQSKTKQNKSTHTHTHARTHGIAYTHTKRETMKSLCIYMYRYKNNLCNTDLDKQDQITNTSCAMNNILL